MAIEPQRDDDSSVNAVIAFTKKFGMVPGWSVYPVGSDVQAVHAYYWPATKQNVLFTRHGHLVEGVWRGGWEVYVQPTKSLSIKDTEISMLTAGINHRMVAMLSHLVDGVAAWPQLDPESDRYEDEMNGGDVVEWLGPWLTRLREYLKATG